jgi:Cu(I)/Ag(I) efflux system membrane fusion protein
MKTRNLRFLLMVAAFLLLFQACTKASPPPPAKNGETPTNMSHQETWTCPMHPQIRKDGPGKCPICGMDLVRAGVGSGEGSTGNDLSHPAGHASIQLSEARRQLIGVRLGTVERKPLFKSIDGPGRVAFDPELYTAQNEYLEALRQVARVQNSPIADVKHSATRMLESAKIRLKVLGLSDQQIKNIANSQNTASSLLIPSPGDLLWIYADVFEMDLPSVRPGLAAKVRGGSLGVSELTGKVVSVDRVINPDTRTAKARIQLLGARPNLRPESFVNVSILAPLGEQITVPFNAVLDTGSEAWVFLSKEDGTIEPRLVTIRFQAGDEVALGPGFQGGERIVTSANFLVDSESRLGGAFTRTSGTEANVPTCPVGEYWHVEMKMCMKKAD